MSWLINLAIRLRERRHDQWFEEATKNPEAAQSEALRSIVARNADTAFGNDHRFWSIATPRHYQRLVPIRDYEALRPYMRRVLAGERGVLSADDPCMFTATSGSTGEPKLIPVTARWRDQMAALTRLWLRRTVRDHPRCFAGSALTLVGAAVEGTTESGYPFGAMSGVTYQNIPSILKHRYALPYEVAHISDYDARYFITMRLALAENVSTIGTPNPTTLLRLADVAHQHADALIKAIHDGTLGIAEPEVHEAGGVTRARVLTAIRSRLRPDPQRASTLARAASMRGRLLPRDAWPQLELIGCWLGGSVGIHARRLRKLYGDRVALRDLGLWASEGRMTIPVEDGTPAGVLAVHANFYEFIAEDEIDDDHPRIFLAHQLEDGKRYYLILTGANGLYRYDINDIVEVRGFHNCTPKVAFVRKGRDSLNITGEKLHLNHVQAALATAERETDLDPWQFALIADADARRYDLLVEFTRAPQSEAQARAFANAFDAELAAQNNEYRSKRVSRRLAAPRLCMMRQGWSDRLARSEISNGRREVQYKWKVMRDAWDAESRASVLDAFAAMSAERELPGYFIGCA